MGHPLSRVQLTFDESDQEGEGTGANARPSSNQLQEVQATEGEVTRTTSEEVTVAEEHELEYNDVIK